MNLNEFENLISQPPNYDETSFLQNFKSNLANIKKCQDYLKDQNCSEKLQIILSSILWDFVRNCDNIQNLSQLDLDFSISDWCLNILLENIQFLSKPTIRTISMIFGYIAYNLWNRIMDAKFQSIVKDQSENKSGLYLNKFCQLNIMNNTILAFSQGYKLCFKNKDEHRLRFSDKLNDIYELAEYYISETDDQDIINIGLQVIFNSFCYGELSTFEDSISSLKHAFTPQNSIRNILTPEKIEFLIQIYIKTQQNYALKSLCYILKMPNSTFNLPVFMEFIDVYTNNLPEILSKFLNIQNPDIIYLVDLIYSYSAILQIKFIEDSDKLKKPFVELTRIIYEFCLSIFTCEGFLRENLRMYSNLMKFWGILSNKFYERKEYSEDLLLVLGQINEITKRYTFTLLQLTLTNDPELIYDVLYDEDTESLASPFHLLISSHVIDIYSLIFEIFEDYLNSQNNQLALSLFIKLSCLMLVKGQETFFDDIKLKKEKLFDQSYKIIEFSTKLIQTDTKAIDTNLELNIQYFIKECKQFFDQNSTQLIISLIYRVIISLQVFGYEDMIIQAATEALESILSIDIKDDKFYPHYKKVCFDLLENFTEFPFFKEIEAKNDIQEKNKLILIKTVYSLSKKYNVLYYIYNFLTGLLNSDDTYNLVISLIAILTSKKSYFDKEIIISENKTKRTEQKLKNETETKNIYNWLLPENISYFVENGKNTSKMNLILNFWQNILRCDFSMFEKHSNYGILAFNAASNTIGSSIEYYIKLISENNRENDQICFQLAENISLCASLLLGRSYIMYDAFQIYNNPSLINFLIVLTDFFKNTDFQNIIELPELFSSCCSLIQSITIKQLKYSPIPLFEQITIFYHNLMNQHQISFYRKKDPIEIFSNVFCSFINFVNYSKRGDIDEIRSITHNCFCTAFCFLMEITINEQVYYYSNTIKELIIHDDSLLNLFKINFVKILSDPTEFNDLYDKFIDDMPRLMNPTTDQNSFAKYLEDFNKKKNNPYDKFNFTETS